MGTYFNITVIAEWCTLFGAILMLNKSTGRWRFFIPLLLITVAVETAGWYMIYILDKKNNSFLFNILMIINLSFFIWILSMTELLYQQRKVFYKIIFCFFACALINLFFIQGPWVYNFYTEIAGDLIILIECCYFFYLIMAEEKFRDLFRYEYFWLATGLIFTSFGSIVLYIFLDTLQAYYYKTNLNIYGYINYGVNLLFYTSLIIAFLCRRKNTK